MVSGNVCSSISSDDAGQTVDSRPAGGNGKTGRWRLVCESDPSQPPCHPERSMRSAKSGVHAESKDPQSSNDLLAVCRHSPRDAGNVTSSCGMEAIPAAVRTEI